MSEKGLKLRDDSIRSAQMRHDIISKGSHNDQAFLGALGDKKNGETRSVDSFAEPKPKFKKQDLSALMGDIS